MLPIASIQNGGDLTTGHSILEGQGFGCCPLPMFFSEFQDFIFREFTGSMKRAPVLPSLAAFIVGIISVITLKKMRWIAACRSVAFMKQKFRRGFLVVECPSNTMSKISPASFGHIASDVEVSIPSIGRCPFPEPTFRFGFNVYIAPKNDLVDLIYRDCFGGWHNWFVLHSLNPSTLRKTH